MTPIFQLCDRYVTQRAALDPIGATTRGLTTNLGAATDYSPQGFAARAALIADTLHTLSTLSVTNAADRRAAAHLRERLEAERAWHEIGEPYRWLNTPIGLLMTITNTLELLPRTTIEEWHLVRDRLAAVPWMLQGWRASLTEGLQRGLPAARRQALAAAEQAEGYARGTHTALVARHGDGPLAGELATAAQAAHSAYADLAHYLRHDYAPHATDQDGVGPERYTIASRLALGSDIDPHEAYAWGWEELARIETEMAAEAAAIAPGGGVDEATRILNETAYVEDADAYLRWLRDWHAWAIQAMDGTHIDLDPRLHALDVTLVHDPTAGAPYYTPPAEDFSRPGRTWWPLANRSHFTTWNELSTIFHEGVPGHHLQLGTARTNSHDISRFTQINAVSGSSEGWALYAERLADELGWFTEPGTRLGMLGKHALRAARVVIDIGVHLNLDRPDATPWTFETAQELLGERGRCAPHRLRPEVVRYFGWPGQAISYKLGERAWLEARNRAETRPGFNLAHWHTTAINLGPLGLDTLAGELDDITATETDKPAQQ